jgi:[ribosomal protein S5]-alanine N-acetyltransferase
MPDTFDFSSLPTLETDHFRLRRMTEADADDIAALYGDEQVMRYLIMEPPCDTRERGIEVINWMNSWFDEKTGLRWGITFRDDDRVIGTCGFHFWEKEHRRADIGYDLKPAYWGNGYMTEIARAVVAWCFDNLNLHRLQGDCTSGNIGSERVLEKAGFTLEGIWREFVFEHGRFVDIKQYGLLRREYFKDDSAL